MMKTTKKMTPKQIGESIGRAIARDHIADGTIGWVGINDQDGDRLTAAGFEPGQKRWTIAINYAREIYETLTAGL